MYYYPYIPSVYQREQQKQTYFFNNLFCYIAEQIIIEISVIIFTIFETFKHNFNF